MSDFHTTEDKLKSAEAANTGMVLLLISVVIGFATHFAVGVIVFFGGLFWVNLSQQQKKERQRALDQRLSLFTMGSIIALRKIYRDAVDDEVRSEVKQFAMFSPLIHGWAFLELDLSDREFQIKCEKDGSGGLYDAAIRKIDSDGPPVLLEGKKLVGAKSGW